MDSNHEKSGQYHNGPSKNLVPPQAPIKIFLANK
jgi:hypothetical protein